jgi:formiminotetrahydrofolate cyclodeaminase
VRAAFDAVVSEAAKHGMDVISSEIVGLVPRAALGEADVRYLRLEGFDAKRQVLEELVSGGEAIGAGSVGAFLDALASDSPTPGGGSVAALSGAAGAALVSMVARLTVGRKGFEEVDARMRELSASADAARAKLLTLADRDAEAFEKVMAAFKMPKETDEEKAERSAAIQRGFKAAADVPLEVARREVALMDLAREALENGNPDAASDGASGAELLAAATECALYNVEINVASLKDADTVRRYSEEVASLRAKAAELRAWTDTRFHERIRP